MRVARDRIAAMSTAAVSATRRATYIRWLKEITSIPTAAGREGLVIQWIRRWTAARRDLTLREVAAGNLIVTRRSNMDRADDPDLPSQSLRQGRRKGKNAPLFVTAHLDHPAFVVRSVHRGGRMAEMEFRGGVHDPYFLGAGIDVHSATSGRRVATGKVVELDSKAKPFKRILVRLEHTAAIDPDLPAQSLRQVRRIGIEAGDIGRWRFRPVLRRSVVKNGLLHAPACDDLAAVAAALAAMDELRRAPGMEHVGLLFTRAEEIGFIGTLAACKAKSVPRNARLICLENSRSFSESPIGGGPILRVGDKSSVFGPELTNRLADIMNEHAKANPKFRWQRKLMPGGTCEATAFSAYGWTSTCLCLPLGNYHNMVDIDGVLAGKRPARVGPEIISIDDYLGLIRMLVVCARDLDSTNVPPLTERLDGLLKQHQGILMD